MMHRLQELRAINNLQQSDLAALIGVTSATYSRKENGTIRFSLTEAKTIADFFDSAIEDIFFDDDCTNIEQYS